jgi:hypothetical protein
MVTKFTSKSFEDGELSATLPSATCVYHVESAAGYPPQTARVDWAWDEPSLHLLCELKDPECAGAMQHNPTATGIMRSELAGDSFPQNLAEKAHQTALHHAASANRPSRVYIVMAAISALTVAEMQTAALLIQKSLSNLGTTMPVIVVNIAEWNKQLTPRTIKRIP